MEFLVIPLIIGIIAVPSPAPWTDLTDFTRIQRALNQEVYLRDASGQERVVDILGVGTDAVTVAVGRQWTIVPRDSVLAVDRVQDGSMDGAVKGALVGLVMGAAVQAAFSEWNGRLLARGVVTYGAIGYLFDQRNAARQKLYRAP